MIPSAPPASRAISPAGDGPLPGVVVHAPEGDPPRGEAVVRNVAHLRPALDASTALELVAHGPGLALLRREGALADAVGALDGVTLVACANTMARLGLEVTDLLPGVVVVPAGIAHLVRRQAEGWAYVRP